MRNLMCFFLLVGLSFSAAAQKVYFIYLQTDNRSPFYVKMNDKIYSSAASGYLILSNLVDSTYRFSVGFPSSKSESRFVVPLGGKDRGFLIKNFQSGLGLFDLQAMTILQEEKQTSDNILYQKRSDDFAYLLSRAANDTSILYAVVVTKTEVVPLKDAIADNPKPVNEEPKLKTENFPVKQDTILITQAPPVQENKLPDTASVKATDLAAQKNMEEKKDKDLPKVTVATVALKTEQGNNNVAQRKDSSVLVPEEVYKRSIVKKYSESSTSEGFGLVYFDADEKGVDTIRILIPNPKFSIRSGETETSQSSDGLLKREELKIDSTVDTPVVVPTNAGTNPKSDCKAVATDNDFFKLRKNMASKQTDDAMVEEAKKAFKGKCFSTEQVKNLSSLFLTSAGKYQFFDAAYLHVTDQEMFSSLQKEIRDEYYLKRFKALIGD